MAFVLSGVAGLAYEVLWSRYLGFFVGHTAYAQILVLAVYLGGMSIGAFVVAETSRRVARPLLWYVGAELVLAAFALLFHPAFTSGTAFAYDTLFPGLGSAGAVGAARWLLAGLLMLPQAVVLGATFPFMAAALARRDPDRAGAAVARAYLWNTLGGAAGVLLTGFVLIGRFGLPGAMAASGALSAAAAALAFTVARAPGEPSLAPVSTAGEASGRWGRAAVPSRPGLPAVLLAVSFGTALASFTYEIGWIRMLGLVLGSATHAFELMLSAFILGIALGSWWIRSRVDAAPDPVGLLGKVQVVMGIGAVASLPLYVATYGAVSFLVGSLPETDGGYLTFNLARYGLCLLVMLPAAVAAGMTLPLITGSLFRLGWGERSIGAVYALNTAGSVAGAALAGLVLLPVLGLKGLILWGAALDVVLGLWLLGRTRVPTWALAAGAAFLVVGLGVRLDRALLTSGVFRFGDLPSEGSKEMLFYADGRTATVSAYVLTNQELIVLSTNGKPDASMGTRWFVEGGDTLPPRPLPPWRDYTTQVLAPMVGMAYVPDMRTAAVIGHGSGMSGRTLLTSPDLERLVTIEIEPAMIEGSRVFVPQNQAVFEDPRSTFVFDDAKSHLAARGERFDMVFAEPSNPWVSGVAGLFSTEFYSRMRDVVAPGGVLVQWVNLYELNDDLFLSIAAALTESFPYYDVYVIGDADVVLVASVDPLAAGPDWTVLDLPAFVQMTGRVPPFRPQHLQAARLFDQGTLGPLLQAVQPNSDYRPSLDLGAEKARFLGTTAAGVLSFATDRLALESAYREAVQLPRPHAVVPARGLRPALDEGHAAWVRAALETADGRPPEAYPGWVLSIQQLRTFLASLARLDDPTRSDWTALVREFQTLEGYVHWGTAGWSEPRLYDPVFAALEREGAPDEARAAVDLLHAVNGFEWERAAGAADVLVSAASAGDEWLDASLLMDAAVLAYVKTGQAVAARNAIRVLAPRTGRPDGDLRTRILSAWIDAPG